MASLPVFSVYCTGSSKVPPAPATAFAGRAEMLGPQADDDLLALRRGG